VVFILVLALSALAYWLAERDAQQITYGTALYFSYTILSLIGYGDNYNPVTAEGKVIVCVIAIIGVGMAGWVVMSLANFFVGKKEVEFLWEIFPNEEVENAN